jgi:hypothetical protein
VQSNEIVPSRPGLPAEARATAVPAVPGGQIQDAFIPVQHGAVPDTLHYDSLLVRVTKCETEDATQLMSAEHSPD